MCCLREGWKLARVVTVEVPEGERMRIRGADCGLEFVGREDGRESVDGGVQETRV